MPWCEDCAKYHAPSAMNDDGTCPVCGAQLAAQQPITAKNIDIRKLAQGDSDVEPTAPWHFKLLMVLLAAYLGWRIIQLFV